MRNIRTGEEKFNIIMESLNSNETIAEICRKYNIAPSLFYKWKEEFFEGAKQRLSGNKPDISLEREVHELKRLVGDQAMAIETFKKNLKGRRR